MMKAVLEIEGFSILTAQNGQEGINTIRGGNRPALILLDMMMPGMNGWDFMDFIRNNANGPKIPVIIVSAFAETARSVKPEAIVSKPIQLKELLHAIEKLSCETRD